MKNELYGFVVTTMLFIHMHEEMTAPETKFRSAVPFN